MQLSENVYNKQTENKKGEQYSSKNKENLLRENIY